jgi:hypothetical protein
LLPIHAPVVVVLRGTIMAGIGLDRQRPMLDVRLCE